MSIEMTEQEFRDMLHDLLEEIKDDYDDEEDIVHMKDITTFQSAGFLTKNEGLVIKMSDDSKFQVTIVKIK